MLLVLDNLEHVIDAALFVSDLLASAPRVTVVATSREPLHIRAEHVFALAPLAVPWIAANERFIPDAAPALQLFTGIAKARRHDFALAGSDVPIACDICRRLDGLPLAIELAAGSLGALSLPGLADRLSRGLDALATGPRDAPARQRTLRATLLWTYRLLDDADRVAFEAMSVFAGGFTWDAAEAVADVRVDVLESLVDKQLITVEPLGGGIRFNMLQTLREFGAERLDKRSDANAVRQRHLEHYLAFAEGVTAELRRTWSPDLIEGELDNIRAALTFASRVPAPEQALRLLIAIADYLAFYSAEGIEWFVDALALPYDNVPRKSVPMPWRHTRTWSSTATGHW